MIPLTLALSLAHATPDAEEAPEACVEVHVEQDAEESRRKDREDKDGYSSARGLHAGLATQFMPQAPAQFVYGQLVGKKDAFFNGEARLDPRGFWVGRVGAGLDLLGAGKLDLTVGLFLGTAGEYAEGGYVRPIAGTQVAFGGHWEKLSMRYRWLAGLGGGPLDSLLSEQELRVGYKVIEPLHVVGSWTLVDPRGAEGARGGVGLGVEVRL
ncbi:MAG: hypothetical protein EP330_05840 [Deltaproteobacteria bacterium]|nr:MAG: hypothetical protein EP330_05840 [Deltaproteobacteria bacterium]